MRIGAIDQGTTSTRILVVEPDGRRHVAHSVEHRQIYPHAGWVEHDPEELIANIRACLDAAGPLDALAIDNQGESCLAWDAVTKQALSPVIVWQDGRTQKRIEQLKADGAEAEVLRRAGLPLDPYFSASKLSWIFHAYPEAREAWKRSALRLGTTDAFFLDRLTGRCVTDAATASRTSLMNLETGTWDPILCELFRAPLVALPEIVPATGDFGAVQTNHGLVPVTASIVDQQAALYGAGRRAPGDAKMTFGTGAFALMVTGREIHRAPERGLLPTVGWRKQGEAAVYALDGGVFTASAAVNWARSLGLFQNLDEINSFSAAPAIDRGLAFVPALSGLACPHWDRDARGAWVGLGLDHGPLDLAQAVLEGVALRAAEVLRAMDACAPLNGPVAVDGGLTQNPYFLQFLADALERPLARSEEPEVTALGAAMLAAETVGAPPPEPAPRSEITPQQNGAHRLERFAEAVGLAQRWGQTSAA